MECDIVANLGFIAVFKASAVVEDSRVFNVAQVFTKKCYLFVVNEKNLGTEERRTEKNYTQMHRK